MHPILFEIGDFPVYTYGPIMALAFLVAFFLVYHIAKKRDEDVEFYMDLYLWIIVSGIVGAKFLYILLDWKSFFADPLEMLNPRRGGLVWYGGMVGAIGMVYFYARRRNKDFLSVTDTLSAPMALGLAIGRWGCLMGGCCYGMPCDPDFPFAVVYPSGPLANEVAGIPVHPVPVYASINALAMAVICYVVLMRGKRTGLATFTGLAYYSITRFLIEFIRGDIHRGFLFKGESFALSTSQFISILVFAASLALLIRLLRKKVEPEQAQKPQKKGMRKK